MTMFAVIDLKTTGLTNAREDRVMEIGVVILDEKYHFVRKFDSLINPQLPLPRNVDHIRGISVQKIQSAPTFQDVLPELMNCLDGTTHFVAHDVHVTHRHLSAELRYCGVSIPQLQQTVSTKLWADYRQVISDGTLPGVASALGIPIFANHDRAIMAAGMTAKALKILHKEVPAVSSTPIAWPRFEMTSDFTRKLPQELRQNAVQDMTCFGLAISPQNEQLKQSRRKLTAEERAARRAPWPGNYGVFKLPEGMEKSATWSWHLFQHSGFSVAEIAQQRNLTVGTVYTHLGRAVCCGVLDIRELASESQIAEISSAWYALREENRYMKLFAAMHSGVPYGLLKCVTESLDAANQQHTGLVTAS